MLINNSAPEKELGLVNGLGQSLASAARCIGPAVGGALWSLSVRTNFLFLNFLFVQVLLIGAVVMGSYLPISIDYGDDVSNSNGNLVDKTDEIDSSSHSFLLQEEGDEEEGGKKELEKNRNRKSNENSSDSP
jgi:hypothetical protein